MDSHFEFWLLAYILAVSVISYLQFGWDKWSALRGAWRLSEASLLFTALIGGALGAKAGQKLFRHKTRKEPFRTWLNTILVFNVIGLVVMMAPASREFVLAAIVEIAVGDKAALVGAQ